MKLESGDILSFELEQRGMTLQFRDGDCGEDHEADTVTLDGVGAMRLMWGLRQIGQGMKPEFKTILEMVGPEGEFIDTCAGRTINPGHCMETGWFILDIAKQRGWDERLVRIGTTIPALKIINTKVTDALRDE